MPLQGASTKNIRRACLKKSRDTSLSPEVRERLRAEAKALLQLPSDYVTINGQLTSTANQQLVDILPQRPLTIGALIDFIASKKVKELKLKLPKLKKIDIEKITNKNFKELIRQIKSDNQKIIKNYNFDKANYNNNLMLPKKST